MSQLEQVFKEYKVCVLIPTYNNATTLPQVLQQIFVHTKQVILVNDGSTDHTLSVAAGFDQLQIISYAQNRGKGFALRAGFKYAVSAGYDYVVTIDSDGQHHADDLLQFVNYLPGHPGAIVIGSRNMDQASVPGKSSFGNKFSNFWFWVETGIKRNDTQSGFRLYPVKRLSALTFYSNKFEFEIEVLVRAAWSGIPVEEVPVRVFYAEKEKRVSHFRPFRDFTRISLLNTVLVTIALVYIKPRDLVRSLKKKNLKQILRNLIFDPSESGERKALSVGFGIFMGIAPIWGFQLITAISGAFLFKLNKPLVILAANISIPPLIPLILYLSYVTGKIWLGSDACDLTFSKGITLEMIHQNFVQYIAGGFTLAVIAGIVFGGITYFGLKIFRRRIEA